MQLNIARLGVVPYGQMLDIQYRLQEMRQQDKIDNTLLLLEHPPVLTLGSRGQYSHIYLPLEELKRQGIEVFEVDRGGDVTYHGPGQIMGYLIFDLRDIDKDIHLFIQKIEQSMINLLEKEYGLTACAKSGKYTGIWVDDKKITAIGVSVKKGVTMHGFALNVNTDLAYFDYINPCGLSKGVTSIEQLLGRKEDIQKVSHKVAMYLAEALGADATEVYLQDLLKERCI